MTFVNPPSCLLSKHEGSGLGDAIMACQVDDDVGLHLAANIGLDNTALQVCQCALIPNQPELPVRLTPISWSSASWADSVFAIPRRVSSSDDR